MTLRVRTKVLLHVWPYNFYDTTLSTEEQRCHIYRLLNFFGNIRHEFIWRRTHELASASPPYERVPNISQYKFNNLFIIYVLHYNQLDSSVLSTYEIKI